MNDDRQAGSKEIGGGGEWTALWELVAKWRKLGDTFSVTRGDAQIEDAYAHCADELEALAAAAPADEDYPGQAYVHAHNPNIKRAEENALGPPRGGSSSDLAGPSNPGVVARQAREYYKTVLNNANMCAAAWLIHEAPIVTEVPSKAERRVASATDGLGVAELRDMLEAACVLAELDEVPAKVTVLRWRAALEGK